MRETSQSRNSHLWYVSEAKSTTIVGTDTSALLGNERCSLSSISHRAQSSTHQAPGSDESPQSGGSAHRRKYHDAMTRALLYIGADFGLGIVTHSIGISRRERARAGVSANYSRLLRATTRTTAHPFDREDDPRGVLTSA